MLISLLIDPVRNFPLARRSSLLRKEIEIHILVYCPEKNTFALKIIQFPHYSHVVEIGSIAFADCIFLHPGRKLFHCDLKLSY